MERDVTYKGEFVRDEKNQKNLFVLPLEVDVETPW